MKLFDLIANSVGTSSVAAMLVNCDHQVGALRPWIGENGKNYVTILNSQGQEEHIPINNVAATLTREAWLEIDATVQRVARERLRIVADLFAAGAVYTIANGFGRTSLETTKMSDVNPAILSMDGNRRSENDRPEFDITNMPLPIAHKDFQLSSRAITASRNGGAPLDLTGIELCTRKVAELLEDLVLGLTYDYAVAGSYLYGLTTFPSRNTRTLTAPTTSNQETVYGEILQMRQDLYDDNYFGPYILYNSPDYDQYMDDDFKANGDLTLRERILKTEGITAVRTCDRLQGTQLVLVQVTSDVIRIINAMPVTTVQWESNGGFNQNFKILAIQPTQVRSDYDGRCGIVHGEVYGGDSFPTTTTTTTTTTT